MGQVKAPDVSALPPPGAGCQSPAQRCGLHLSLTGSPTVQQGRLKFLSLADPLEGAEDAGEHSAVIRRSVHQRAVVLISCFCCIQALPSALVVSAASQHVLHTHTHTDAVVSYRETAAQEKHSHVNVMYKIFSNGGENKHNTTLFELVASTSTLI